MTNTETSEQIASLIHEICDVRFSDLTQDLACCEKLLALGASSDDRYAVCFAHTYLGDCYHAMGDFVSSEQHLIKGREYSRRYGFVDLLLDNYLFSGHLFLRIGNEQRSLDYFLEGLSLSKREEKPAMTSVFYNSMAIIFNTLGDKKEAMKCFETAYELHNGNIDSDTDLRRYIILLANISEVACEVDMYDRAKSALEEAEALIKQSRIDPMEFLSVYFAKVCCAAVEAPETVQGVLDELFAYNLEECIDKGLVFDTLITIAKRLLKLSEHSCLAQVMDLLTTISKGTEYEHSLMLQSFRIKIWQDTHGEEDNIALYKDFYTAYISGDAISQEMRAAGMMAKIGLHQTLEEKEAVQARSAQLEKAAYIDELTQTYNRRYLSDLIEKLNKGDIARNVSIAMVDLDYFKEYNDSYGHMGGDNALRVVAECLRRHASNSTTIVRYGGDEFVCVCFDISDEEMGNYLEQVHLDLAGQAIEHKNSRCQDKVISLSVGYCSMLVQNAGEFEKVLANADRALYVSKYKGRNTISRFV